MRTDMVLETSVSFIDLTRLIALENCTEGRQGWTNGKSKYRKKEGKKKCAKNGRKRVKENGGKVKGERQERKIDERSSINRLMDCGCVPVN
jgi:hypothetical protein